MLRQCCRGHCQLASQISFEYQRPNRILKTTIRSDRPRKPDQPKHSPYHEEVKTGDPHVPANAATDALMRAFRGPHQSSHSRTGDAAAYSSNLIGADTQRSRNTFAISRIRFEAMANVT